MLKIDLDMYSPSQCVGLFADLPAPLSNNVRNDHVLLVCMTDNKDGSYKAEYMLNIAYDYENGEVDYDNLEEAQDIMNEFCDAFVIIRGFGVRATDEYFDYVFNSDNRTYFILDALVVDWEHRWYISDMCTDSSCCDALNPRKF